MSGGVDSSVSASLLKKEDHDVTGVFIRAWHPDFASCTWQEDRRDAKKVASILNIPLLTLNLEKEYKKNVIDYMFEEYRLGRTPNPDVICNKSIKFGEFFKWAKAQGADYIASGHYARVENSNGVNLLKGVDDNKDQSYFLWAVKKDALTRTIFPIGGLEKSSVRKHAERTGLPIATKPDSQGLCFVGKFDFKQFLKEHLPVKRGDVLNTNGEIIGEHDGAILYTMGERHNFKTTKKSEKDVPLYVVGRDFNKNEIVVSETKKTGEGYRKEVPLNNINWIRIPLGDKTYTVRIRYRGVLYKCHVEKDTVIFDSPVDGVTAGQSCVVYDGDICMGGGIIT